MNGAAKWEKIRARMAKILATEGTLTADAVLKDAKSPRSPLHPEFQWDDGVAGHLYRLEQARDLIGRVKVYIETTTHTVHVPEYVRDPAAGSREQGYTSVLALKDDRGKALDVLRNEAQRAAAHLQRTRDLAAALDMDGELEPILESFAAFRSRVTA